MCGWSLCADDALSRFNELRGRLCVDTRGRAQIKVRGEVGSAVKYGHTRYIATYQSVGQRHVSLFMIYFSLVGNGWLRSLQRSRPIVCQHWRTQCKTPITSDCNGSPATEQACQLLRSSSDHRLAVTESAFQDHQLSSLSSYRLQFSIPLAQGSSLPRYVSSNTIAQHSYPSN
ncbi:hypothetical protein BDW22DRAFT_792356 [Trametopsis cervina]|nr:hypothetical protein BDW22DRAFT_792356 [Trametopsis cervina]